MYSCSACFCFPVWFFWVKKLEGKRVLQKCPKRVTAQTYIAERIDTSTGTQMENHHSFFITGFGWYYFISLDCLQCIQFPFFLQNETVLAGNGTCTPAEKQRAEIDSHEVTEPCVPCSCT